MRSHVVLADGSVFGTGAILEPSDKDWPLREVVPAATGETQRMWRIGKERLNQGMRPACVGFSAQNWLRSGPVFNKPGQTNLTATQIWEESQLRHFGSKDPDRGSEPRAAFDFLRERGLVAEYYSEDGLSGDQAVNPEVRDAEVDQRVGRIINAVLTKGPVQLSTGWQDRMGQVDLKGFVKWKDGDPYPSAHAFLVYGVDLEDARPHFLMENSWGGNWGAIGGWKTDRDGNRIQYRTGLAKMEIALVKNAFRYYGRAILAVETSTGK